MPLEIPISNVRPTKRSLKEGEKVFYMGTDGKFRLFVKNKGVLWSQALEKVRSDEKDYSSLTVGSRKGMVQISDEGVFRLYGNAVAWDDLRFPTSSVRLSPAQPPTETSYVSGLVLSFPTTADKTIFFNVQMPHAWKESSDIEFHVHYALSLAGSGVGAENVKWDFTHSWSNINGSIPAATTVNKTIDVQDLTTSTHYLGEVAGTISGAGKTFSSCLICSLTRDVGVANDYGGSVYFISGDFHYQIDTFGSREELVKY